MSTPQARAAQIFDKHRDLTDRAAEYGCACGAPGAYETHLAQVLHDAGLLATPPPHRDTLAATIARGYEPTHGVPNRHDYRAADAVLTLLQGKHQ